VLVAWSAGAFAAPLTYGPILGRGVTGDRMLVKFGLPSSQASSVYVRKSGAGAFSSVAASESCAHAPRCDYEAELTGLDADASYEYYVAAGATTYSTASFGTCPPSGAPLDVVFYGDSQSGAAAHAVLAGRVLVKDPDIVFESGDVTYGGGYDSYLSEFFPAVQSVVQTIPFMASPGNHDNDSGDLKNNFGALFPAPRPAGDPWRAYYAFACAGVRFIALDSNRVSDAAQLTFLTAQLAAASTDASIDHVLVWFHHSPYSVGVHGDDAGVQQSWVPLFDDPKNKVTAVFTGHDHSYQRLSNGSKTTYVVSGAAGAPLTTVTGSSKATVLKSSSAYHFVSLHIVGPLVSANVYDSIGGTIDTWTSDVAGVCPHAFTYAGSSTVPLTGTEKTVEVIGSFTGWQNGIVMSFDGTSYRANASLPAGKAIAYKYRLTYNDGSQKWVTDPGNPLTESDGFGGFNSSLAAVSCEVGDGGAPTDAGEADAGVELLADGGVDGGEAGTSGGCSAMGSSGPPHGILLLAGLALLGYASARQRRRTSSASAAAESAASSS
jgi:acid phosphatase type 7